MQNTITFNTEHDYFDALLELTKRGLTFTSNGSNYTITLTGGY